MLIRWWMGFFAALLMSVAGLWSCLFLFMVSAMWDLPVRPPFWYTPFPWFCVALVACLAAPIYALTTRKKTWLRLAAFAIAPPIYPLWNLLWPVAMGPSW